MFWSEDFWIQDREDVAHDLVLTFLFLGLEVSISFFRRTLCSRLYVARQLTVAQVAPE